jgi:lipid II:glycine glycyltransferase (peptidoglycan interpeptide bridge formation enzyme)
MRWIFTVIAIALVAFCATRCASIPSQKDAIIAQAKDNQKSKDLVKKSNLTQQEKAEVQEDLDDSLEIARKAEKRSDQLQSENVALKAEIERLQWYESLFWKAVWALAGVALASGLAWYFLRKR